MSDGEWYLVVAFFASRIDGVLLDDALYEEIHYIVKAESLEDAKEHAEELSRSQCHSYSNVSGESVAWELACPPMVKEMDAPPSSGTEVFSRFLDAGTFRALAESGPVAEDE